MTHQTLVAAMNELDGKFFNGDDDVAFAVTINEIDHGNERSRFPQPVGPVTGIKPRRSRQSVLMTWGNADPQGVVPY